MPVSRCLTILRSCSLVFITLAVMFPMASKSHAKTWPTPTASHLISTAGADLSSSEKTEGAMGTEGTNHVAMYKVSEFLERVKGLLNKVGGRHQNSPTPVMSESTTG